MMIDGQRFDKFVSDEIDQATVVLNPVLNSTDNKSIRKNSVLGCCRPAKSVWDSLTDKRLVDEHLKDL